MTSRVLATGASPVSTLIISTCTYCTGEVDTDLSEAVAGFEKSTRGGENSRLGRVQRQSRRHGKISFRVPDGHRCATNQVLYNLGRRGIEYDLLPYAARRGRGLCVALKTKLMTIPANAGLAQSAAVLRVGQYSVNRDQLKHHHMDIVVSHRRFDGERQRMEVMGNASYARSIVG